MRFLLIALLFVFLNADVLKIINLIKKIEEFKISCTKELNYNIFTKSKEIKNNFIESVKINKPRMKIPLKLSAIFENKAYINGRWISVGDEILGFRVVKIKDDKVYLEKSGKIFILSSKLNILKVKE